MGSLIAVRATDLSLAIAGRAVVVEPDGVLDAEDEAGGPQGQPEEQEQARQPRAHRRQEGAQGHPDTRHRPR